MVFSGGPSGLGLVALFLYGFTYLLFVTTMIVLLAWLIRHWR